MVKLLDSKNILSVQVHPNDKYAEIYETSLGKTELWYIISHEPDAFIYLGFEHEISKKEFDRIVKAIKNYKKIQIYSRAFLSFTLNENKSHNFLKPETEDLIPIKFKIKPKKDGEIFSSNADIRQYSVYNEEEILFFPF